MTRQHLIATDRDIADLVHAARTTSEAAHPLHGNFIADVLDALVAYNMAIEPDTAAQTAEILTDAAFALRQQADKVAS